MKLLRALLAIFRHPAPAPDAYEAEVLFAGWVEVPPLLRQVGNQLPPAAESKRTISA